MDFLNKLKAYYTAHTAYLDCKRELFGLTLWRPVNVAPERILICPVCSGKQEIVVEFQGRPTKMPCPMNNGGEIVLYTPGVCTESPSDSMLDALPWGNGPSGFGISESPEEALAHAEDNQKHLLHRIEADIRRYLPDWKMPEFKDWPIRTA